MTGSYSREIPGDTCRRPRAVSIWTKCVAAALLLPGAATVRADDAGSSLVRTEVVVILPTVQMRDQEGRAVDLRKLVGTGKPVVVEFFFTSCTTICPVRSATFGSASAVLSERGRSARFVSISIDPEHDTPDRLREYRKQFRRRPAEWHLLTGSSDDVARIQSAFDARNPSDDRMLHRPITFVYTGRAGNWVRLDGMASGRDLAQVVTAVDPSGHPPG